MKLEAAMSALDGGAETSSKRARTAFTCFVAYLAVAYPLIVLYFGRNEWFVRGDWNLIAPGVIESVFDPVEQHWSTLPILIYRAYFRWFGANYLPFLATVAALHLGNVFLLRIVMRRSAVGPWTSTLASALLVLFGAGFMSIVFSIQITQNLSIVLSLAQLILADHDGRFDERDWIGLALGAVSLMCSGLAPILVICVGLATLARRGWLLAAAHTVPLAGLWGGWFVRNRALSNADMYRLPYEQGHPFRYVWHGLGGSLRALGHFDVVALVMVVMLVAGLGLRLRSHWGSLSSSRTSMVLALLGCAPLYFAILGLQRSRLADSYALFSHHTYTAACFALPALAVAADSLVVRFKALSHVAAAVAVALVALNARHFGSDELRDPPNKTIAMQGCRDLILSTAHSPYAARALHLDRNKNIALGCANYISLGWALEQAKIGKLPKPGIVGAQLEDYVELFYGITDVGYPPDGSCTERVERHVVQPNPGDLIGVGDAITVTNIRRDPHSPVTVPFIWPGGTGHVIRIELPGMHLRLDPTREASSFSYCRGPIEPEPFEKVVRKQLAEAIQADPVARESIRQAMTKDPDAMAALRGAMAKDPAAMEALRKAMSAGARH